jgi:hypothetical protein
MTLYDLIDGNVQIGIARSKTLEVYAEHTSLEASSKSRMVIKQDIQLLMSQSLTFLSVVL